MEVSPPKTTEQLLPDIEATVSTIVEQYIHEVLLTTDQNLTAHQKERVAIFQDIIRNVSGENFLSFQLGCYLRLSEKRLIDFYP